MPFHSALTQYFTREELSKAEPIVADALSKLRRPIDSLKFNELPYAARKAIGVEFAKLNVPYEAKGHLVERVLQRRQTRAILAIFRGEQSLIEAAEETKIRQIILAKELERRRPELEQIFGHEGRVLRRASGAQERDAASENLDAADLSLWDWGPEQYKAILEAARRAGTKPSDFIGAWEAFRLKIFDERDRRKIARQICLLISQQGQEPQHEALPIEELHLVIEHLAQLAAATDQKNIAEYRVAAPDGSSRSASSRLSKPGPRQNTNKH
jgi:hypothetical protein